MTGNAHQRLLPLFNAALELPPGERESFLREHTVDDPDLRSELEALLAADARTAGLTARPVLPGLGRLIVDTQESESVIGTRVGPFVLRQELGRGGMGRVFLAERVDGEVQQQVAIKLVRSELADPDAQRRFRRERELLARLDHPAIARLVDAAQLPGGTPYLVMEYVDGRTLTDYCEHAGLDLRARVALLARICDAVAAAHRQLIVHRDLKPANVLVQADGSPKLLDFGIAKLLDDAGDGPSVTGTAQRYFSPNYAAPEQLTGAPIGVACDVYGIGLLLYEALAGALPFDLAGLTPSQAERLITGTPPAPPSVTAARSTLAAVRARARGLRGDLDQIILRCLRKAPAERYASIDRLESDLRNYLEGRPVSARGGHAWYRLRKFVGRNRVAVSAATLGAVALLGFIAAVVLGSQRLAAERDLARAERDHADQAVRFLVDVFKSADPHNSLTRTTAIGEVVDNARKRLADDLARAPAQHGRLATALAQVYLDIGDGEVAQSLLDQVAPAYDAPDSDPRARIDYLKTLAQVVGDRGDAARKAELLEAALALHRRLGDPVALTWEAEYQQAEAINSLGERQRAVGLMDALVKRLDADPGVDPSAAPQVLTVAGFSYATLDRPDDAEPRLREAVARLEKQVAPNDPRLLEAKLDLGDTLDFGRHQPEQALVLFAEVIAEQTKLFGPDSASVARSLIYQGNARQHLKQFDLALADFQRSLAIYSRIHHQPHADLMAVNFNIAGLEMERDHLDAAAAAFEEAYRVAEVVFPENSTNLASIRFEIGRIRLSQGRLDEAIELLTSAAARSEATGKGLEIHLCHAEALVQRGRMAEAKDELSGTRAAVEANEPHPDPPCRSWKELWQAAAAP